MNMAEQIHRLGNTLGILFISLALGYAFYDQFHAHDLPCPLCLLQRACFIAVAIGMSMNLILGISAKHYGLIILSALSGLFIAVRQIFLHIAPGDPGYGDAIMGLHFYTWAAIVFCLIIGFSAIALLMSDAFTTNKYKLNLIQKMIIGLFVLLIVGNIISTFFECGFGACVANPVDYQLMERL